MESIDLVATLRRAGNPTIPGDTGPWLDAVRPLLPAEPLPSAFLEEALGPLSGLGKAYALEILALLGRREIADFTAGLVPAEEDGSVRLFYAEILLKLGDQRACDILVDLCRASLGRGERPGSVPVNWIYTALHERGENDALAEECLMKVAALTMKIDVSVDDCAMSVELRDGRPHCAAADKRWFPLTSVLSSAWGTDGGFLADLLERRCGFDKDGVGFSYDGDGPDEAPDGKVRVHFLDDRLVLEQAFFEKAAVEFGLAALSLLRAVELPASEAVEKRLIALRARI